MNKSFEVVPNSLSDEEIQYLLNMVKDNSSPDPKPLFEGTGVLNKEMLDANQYPDNLDPEKLILKIIDKVKNYYLTTHELLGELVFSRVFGVTMLEGAELSAHRDEDANEQGDFDGKRRSHVCSIILNDDYRGGYLLFPDEDKSVKPAAGSMVFFPGYYVSHGVSKITKGTRRVLLVFFYDVLA